MRFDRLLRVVTILGVVAAFNVIPRMAQAKYSGRSALSPDPADWPVITPDNASYLALLGVYGHGRNTQALWGRDGHTIIVGGDRGLWLYDSRTPDAPPRALDEPDLPVRSMTISHDGRLLAVSAGQESDESDFNDAGIGGSIRIWDLATGTLQIQVKTTPGALSFSSNDTQLLENVSYYNCCAELDVWSVNAGQLLGKFAAFYYFNSQNLDRMTDPNTARRFVVGRRAQLFAFIDTVGNIEVWSAAKTTLAEQDDQYGYSQNIANIPANQVISPHLHPPLIAINWPGQRLWVFDLVRLAFVDTIDLRPPSPDPDLTLSPDGTLRVVVEGGVVKLRDVKTDNLIATLGGQAVQDFAFSLDDRFVALFDSSKTVDIMDVATGQLKYTLHGHAGPVLHGAFSPDGRWLATTSSDQTVRLWDASNGQLQRTWNVGSKLVSLAFSPDNAELAVNTSDSIIRVWSVVTGQLLAKLGGYFASNVDQIVFHPSGVLSILSQGTLGQWDWRSDRTRDIHFDTAPKTYANVLAIRSNGATAVGLISGQQNSSSVEIYELPGLDDWSDKSNYSTQNATLRSTSTCFFISWGSVYNPAGDLMAWNYDERGNDGLRTGYIYVSSPSVDCQILSEGGNFTNQTGKQWFYKDEFSAGGHLLAATTEQGGLDIWRVVFPLSLYF